VWTSKDQQYPKTERIVIPETIQHELTFAGEVMAAGPECADVSRGNKVLFSPYHGVWMKTDKGGKAVLINEQYIEAVVDEWPEHVQMTQREVREAVA